MQPLPNPCCHPVFVSLMTLSSTSIYADNHTQLAPIVITAQPDQIAFTIQKQLAEFSGATNFIDTETLQQQRTASLADVFQLQAGIYAQSAGNEGTKISIRGSGINRASGAHASGIFTLLDDIPFTGPGGTPYELLESWWIDHAEVYRGANGFEKAALALGGAINYVSPSGKNQMGQQLRYELGQNGYQKYLFSHGAKYDAIDVYIAASASEYDGFQKHAAGSSQGLMLNVGYQPHDNFSTRFFARYRETEHQTPGRLTQAQIATDPTQANPYAIEHDTQRIQPGSTWLANQSTWTLADDATVQTSLAYHQYPMDLQESPYRLQVDYQDVTAKIVYEKPYTAWDLAHTTQFSLRSTTHLPMSGVNERIRRDQMIDGQRYPSGTLIRQYSYLGSDHVLQWQQRTDINDQLRLYLALAALYTHRETQVTEPKVENKINQYQWDFAPRLGLNYQLNSDVSLFSNISRSVEPAHPWSMLWGTSSRFPQGSGAATGRQNIPIELAAQTAKSIEIGTRGQSEKWNWELSYYYSKLKNELLSIEVNLPHTPAYIAEANASPTIHQGLELALQTTLYDFQGHGRLYVDQSYTFSDFHFKHDTQLNKNELAGIPRHYYQAKLGFQHALGAYMALHTEYASSMPVDYANSIYTDDYQIWHLSLGYQPIQQDWQVWLNFKNITDQKYAATVTPAYNDFGRDEARSTPGEGFASYAGISLKF